MYVDKDSMGDRIYRVETRDALYQDPPSRTVHSLGQSLDLHSSSTAVHLDTPFTAADLRFERLHVFHGRLRHVVVWDGEGDAPIIESKQVRLIDCDRPLPNLPTFL
jgi:3-phenylpropionate/cinnamic acid dioxygenase small subunit